ncbi:choice-of-anchor I family protein [Pseudodesulfovibrio thermohalotolerans]|uniref:choice-of-anchor I family protein n=1 Tax=Pseudodesulfovibrio thermohalotolerans TaxID=2880651 RepID=UPI002441DE50|nr:choice-of-anchor I family protein [Pseudodesulfovibrio thermohalotolerans]WFS63517.1 choice-of-anchor I family protein [Pseudodesulfovibrio thermohalotolerans]
MPQLLLALLVLLLAAVPAAALELTPAGRYASGVFDESAAEIVVYDPEVGQAYVVNGHMNVVDVLDVSDIRNPVKKTSFDFSAYGTALNSVACRDGMIAVAVEAAPKQAPGHVVVADRTGNVLAAFRVGAQPDMVTFSPDGKYILAACEGGPDDACSVDPEGSISIIDISPGLDKAVNRSAGFAAFNPLRKHLKARGVRLSHPGSTVAQDLEPEYIAVSPDSRLAFVTLQENNSVAVVDIPKATVVEILGLGLKDWSGLVMDASDKDKAVNLRQWPVYSAYMPDGIAAYAVNGRNYFVTANEGDSREYDEYADEKRLSKVELDPRAFPEGGKLQDNKALGRLKTITDLSDTDGDGDYDRIVAFGGRSFSIWDENGSLVFDSGDRFERILARFHAYGFNADSDKNKFDKRSDDKGCEPEGAEIGVVDGRTYVFIGLERMGGVMVFDITDPQNPFFETYRLDRDFSGDPKEGTAGDLGPEGVHFVPAAESGTGDALLFVGNETSGTTTIYTVR